MTGISGRGTGVNDAELVTAHFFAKENSDISPYLVPNEWICGQLATFLQLPVPPQALFKSGQRSKGMFGSLDFRRGDSTPPDVIPSKCVHNLPWVCAGVVVFDILIANADRHSGNMKVDDPTNPRELVVFDHERALFGYRKDQAVDRLTRLIGRLGISAGSESTGNPHCFLDLLQSSDDLWNWAERVYSIPDWFIEEICSDSPAPKRLAKAAAKFLLHRKASVFNIMSSNKDKFPSIRTWGLWS